MNKLSTLTYTLLVSVIFCLTSCSSNEDKAKSTALQYLQESHKDDTETIRKYENINVSIDTIPEYFRDDALSLGRKAAVAISCLKSIKINQQYGYGGVINASTGREMTEEDCKLDIYLLQQKLDELHQQINPAVGYVVTIVEKFQHKGDIERESKEVLLVDRNDPTKVLKHWSFYGADIDAIIAIKAFQPYGDPCKADVLGNMTKNQWYNVERFILDNNLDMKRLLE